MKITNSNITKLKKNEVFVFGSNLNGNHAGGAAKLAQDKFGAIDGQAKGLQGQSYAIPTLGYDMKKVSLEDLKRWVNEFIQFAINTPKKSFLVTEIGCGIAGFTIAEIAPLFKSALDIENISLPEQFINSYIVKGYKVTNSDMSCRGFKFELGKKYSQTGVIKACNNGFHFCIKVNDCFEYYNFDTNNRVFEVIGSGDLDHEADKTCSQHIEFVRELTWLEVLELCNSGKNNTGRSNSGNWNSGNWNSGNRNSGDRNSGDRNSGDRNSGNWNSGNWNSGDSNSGYRNSGNRNSGDSNSGNWNSGDRNSGYRNSGNRNSGDWNSGDSNSGYRNSGNRNSGDRNSGDRNSGDWNSGDSNSGNWNSGDRNSGDSNSGYRNGGAFCTDPNPKLILFDKESTMTVKEWENHPACELMYKINPNIWIYASEMTDEEKKVNPKYETTDGYLKSISMKEAWGSMWYNLSDDKKKIITSLENFNKDKFFEITGIKL